MSNVIAGVAFSLVLTAVIMFLGLDMSPGHGAMLGFAGFIAVSLAPSAGLSPELPGMPAAELWPDRSGGGVRWSPPVSASA